MTFKESSPANVDEFMSLWIVMNVARINKNMIVEAAIERDYVVARDKEERDKESHPVAEEERCFRDERSR